MKIRRAASTLSSVLLALLALTSNLSAAGAGRLTVRVLDAETGQPLSARLDLRSSDGQHPGDRLACTADRWPNVEAHGVFISGAETFELPPGKTAVTAAHGLEYQAEALETEVEPGKTSVVKLKLRRVFNMRRAGWLAGDMHVHMLHGEHQRPTSYADVAATCAGNGLDFTYVCQEYVGAGQLDLKGYEAECEKVSTDRFRMFVGAERPQSLLGHQVMLGVPDPFVIGEDPPYHAAARKAHAAGGAVVYVHPLRYFPGRQYEGKWLDFPGNNLARELVFDSFLGPSYDGLSVLSDEPANPEAYALWFNLLNRGLSVPVFADSDACFDRPTLGMKAPGFWTTYLYVGPNGKPDHASLSEAVRRGQTLATTGPLLQFKVDGQISGATLPPDGKPHAVEIEAWLPQHAFSLRAIDPKSGRKEGIGRVELIRNGRVVKTWEPHSPHVRITDAVTEKEPCWYVLWVFGEDAKWQVGVASPIYFAGEPRAGKREPFAAVVRGRIYDFRTGAARAGTVEVVRDGRVLKRFSARDRFRVRMPLDAEVVVRADGFRPERRNLLMDYGPVHKFLWYLESRDLARPETLDQFERLVRTVDLEFPLGYKLPGSYFADGAPDELDWQSLRVAGGPERRRDGALAVAAVLMDAEQVNPGDVIRLAAVYRDEGGAGAVGPLVVEARGYDPSRPSGDNELKKFAEFEKTWGTATDLGDGYRLVSGTLKVAEWVRPGPTGGVDLSIRARKGNGDAAFLGLHVPLGAYRGALSLTTGWPALPLSWPDRNYGVGPFLACCRSGSEGGARSDYRTLHLQVKAGEKTLDLLPARDARGCADADDALYADQYYDQILSEISHRASPPPIRPQPVITWTDDTPIVDATAGSGGQPTR